MIDEDEHSVSEDCCERDLLFLPVPNGCRLHTVLAEVDERSNVHEAQYDYSRDGGEDLQVFRILNVTKAEGNAEGSKDQNRDRINARKLLFKRALIAVDKEGDALIEGFCSRNVFKAHGTVHVNNENSHDRVFDPGASDAISNLSQLELLTYVEFALLVLKVGVILATL